MQQALKETEVLQEIKTAYSKFLQALPKQAVQGSYQWRAPAHRCEQTCDFFMHRNVVICKATHNWHYCTKSTCDRMIRNHECQVCPLLGMAYDLEFEFDQYGETYNADCNGAPAAADDDDEEEGQPDADDYGDQTIEPIVKQEEITSSAPTRHAPAWDRPPTVMVIAMLPGALALGPSDELDLLAVSESDSEQSPLEDLLQD